MARLGSGTTTDTTSTSNELYYAGEAFRLAYDVGTGTGSRREHTDFTGNMITAKAIAVEVTDNDTSTAVPLGSCKIDQTDNTEVGTITTFANCSLQWKQNTPVDLIPEGARDISTGDGICSSSTYLQEGTCIARGICTETDGTQTDTDSTGCDVLGGEFVPHTWAPNTVKPLGQFYIYIPKTVLKDVGFTVAPQPGSPLYIAYSVDYTESDLSNSGDAETRVIETDVIGFRWTPMFDITA